GAFIFNNLFYFWHFIFLTNQNKKSFMKKLLYSALFFCTSFFSHSQYYGGMFCLDCYSSIEIGAISSNISGFEGASAKTGFYFGIYQFADLSDSFALRYGTSYTNIGSKIKGFDDPLIIHSINFPLSLHYAYQEQFQGFIGGELGTNFFGKLPLSEGGDAFDQSFEFRDKFTLFDVSIFAGVGYILADNIDFNLRYNFGVTNVSLDSEQDWKKNWLTLSVAYTFRE